MRWPVIFWSALLFVDLVPCGSTAPVNDESGTHSHEPTAEHQQVNYADRLKQLIGNFLDGQASGFKRQLLSADLSTECSVGLLKFVRGIRNLEPWAMRLVDASGKYPTGALQSTLTDLGAFDECVETVVHDEYGTETIRGQYCNLRLFAGGNRTDLEGYLIKAIVMTHPRLGRVREHTGEKFLEAFYDNLPILRLGICTLDECSEEDLQKLFRAVLPSSLGVTVTDCVTSVAPAVTRGQIIIIAFLGSLGLMVVLGTAVDVCIPQKKHSSQIKRILLCAATSFSLVSNTRTLLHVAADKFSEGYRYRFLHGMRFLSIVWVVLGHCYGSPSEVWSRLANNWIYADHWKYVILTSGFISVDTFFFLSGFLLALVACKERGNCMVTFGLGVARRFGRTMAPVFFVIMCLHLLPLMASGPGAKAFFRELHEETQEKWLSLLLQVVNYKFGEIDIASRAFIPFWYLSVDFQLFLLSFPILLLLKRRAKCAVAIFALLSLLGCSIATWQVAGNQMTPFAMALTERLATVQETIGRYYFYPFYHAVCYFTGCATFFLVAWYKERKISKAFQTAAWCIAIASGLGCVFVKAPWYQTVEQTDEFGKLSLAFFDRILWSVCLMWITLACATGRGGFLCTFLSWSALAPLSRLAFGVYIVHWPFLNLVLQITPERMFFSYFVVVSFFFSVLLWSYLLSYLLFVFCEAPAVRLSKLILDSPRKITAMESGDAGPTAVDRGGDRPSTVAVDLGNEENEPARSANESNSFNGSDCHRANLTSCRL
ncbi:nose resistant to fluoxetine protein 6-like [Haemaphysalis longicornis]